jgi:hypothetical protein
MENDIAKAEFEEAVCIALLEILEARDDLYEHWMRLGVEVTVRTI